MTPVLFLADGPRLVVVGSNGGASNHPAWVHDLRANPTATVEVGRRRLEVRARQATDEERATYWPPLLEIYPSYGLYERRTDRRLPVFLLEPTGTDPATI